MFYCSSKEDHDFLFLEAPYDHMAEVSVEAHCFIKQLSFR